MSKHLRFLEHLYLLGLLVVVILIALIPYLISGGFYFLVEEAAEGIAIISLFVAGYFIMLFYQKEVSKNSVLF